MPSEPLAVHGGPPVRTQPWQGNLTLDQKEEEAACRALRRGLLSLFEGAHQPDPPFSFWGGPEIRRLEESWCATYQAPYAVAMNSATSGLIAAIGALGIGYGEEVIVSAYTMCAAATAPLFYGALPIFADVRLETGSLDPASIEQRISPRTRAILVVHQFGIPAEMDRILELANRHRLKVIEDCAQAHGARYKGKPVGTWGQIGVFSLNVNKTIQSGEGGVCITRDETLRQRLALIRNHAEAVAEGASLEDLTNLLGFNFRMTEVTAAIAHEQLKKLDHLNARRIELVETLSRALGEHPFLVPPPRCPHAAWDSSCPFACRSTYYLYPLRFLRDKAPFSRSEFARLLKAEGIPFSEGYVRPLYELPLFRKKTLFPNGYPFQAPPNRPIETNYHPGACPNAEWLYSQEMLINEYVRPPHTLEEMGQIARAVRKLVRALAPTKEVLRS